MDIKKLVEILSVIGFILLTIFVWNKSFLKEQNLFITPDNVPEKLQIEIYSPLKGEAISNPLEIKGKAKGAWFFEASFPIYIVDDKGNDLGQGIATAIDDWMTTDFVNFEAEINFAIPIYAKTGFIIFNRDNPSGLPENDFSYKYPITFKYK